MKKNYFYGLFKSFGIIPILALSAFYMYLANAGVQSATGYLNVMLCTLFASFAVIGLSGLKSDKVEFPDFLRITAFLGACGYIAVYAMQDPITLWLIVLYGVFAGVLLLEIIIRIIFGRYNFEEKIGFTCYTSALAKRINPLLILIVGIALGVVVYYLTGRVAEFDTYFANFISFVPGISLGIVFSVLLLSSFKGEKSAGILDILLAVFFFTGLTVILFSVEKLPVEQFTACLALTLSCLAGLLIRGASFSQSETRMPKLKINRYFADLYQKYNVSFSVLLGACIVALISFSTIGTTAYSRFTEALSFGALHVSGSDNEYMLYGAFAIGVLILLLPLIARKVKNPEIKVIDESTNVLVHCALLGLPYILIVLTGTADFWNTLPVLLVFIVMAVMLVTAVLWQIIRLVYYKGNTDLTVAPAEEESSLEETENLKEDTPEEAVAEEVVEPILEETAPAEEIAEEPIDGEAGEEAVEIVYVDEEGNPVEISEEDIEPETLEVLEDEEEEQEQDEAEEEVFEPEEQPEAMEPEEAPAKEKSILMPEVTIVDEEGNPKKIKRKFNTRMMFAPYEAKEYYNEIKNYLIMYRAKGRYSSRCETFRYRGLVAKVALAGKSIKVCLALDPQVLEGTKYHFKDVSAKRQYAEVPVMIKVRSPRGLKYFKELVDMMMAIRGVKPKRNYQPTNFMPSLIPNGEAILATLGMSTDYLYTMMNAKSIPAELPDDLADYLPVIQGEELEGEEVEAVIYLDTLCNHFIDGDEITIDVLKSLHIVTKGNVLHVKARGTLDRRLIIYAEYFDSDALKMLMCTNCTAIKIIR